MINDNNGKCVIFKMYKIPWIIVTKSMDWCLGKHYCAHTSPLISSPFIPLNHNQHTHTHSDGFHKTLPGFLIRNCLFICLFKLFSSFYHTHFTEMLKCNEWWYMWCFMCCVWALYSTHILKLCELLCVRTSNAVYLINREKISPWGRTERDTLLWIPIHLTPVLFFIQTKIRKT